jgi:hypothetical protein
MLVTSYTNFALWGTFTSGQISTFSNYCDKTRNNSALVFVLQKLLKYWRGGNGSVELNSLTEVITNTGAFKTLFELRESLGPFKPHFHPNYVMLMLSVHIRTVSKTYFHA